MNSYRVPFAPKLEENLELFLPGSKSITNRVLILSALSEGKVLLKNFLLSDDSRYMLKALQDLGYDAVLDEESREVRMKGGGNPSGSAKLFVGNSGTTMRFLTTMLTVAEGDFEIDGDERMRERPISDLVNALRGIGAEIEYLEKEGYPPLKILAHKILGEACSIPASVSSQYISSLLLSAPKMQNGLNLNLLGEVASKPYIDMTISMMKDFGATAHWESENKICVEPGVYQSPSEYAIEPDASGASYFMALPAVLGGKMTLSGLGAASIQGDILFARVLEQMGCKVEMKENEMIIEGGKLSGIDIDMNAIPDMVPTLGALALFADSPTTIRNVPNLRVKECDRISAMVTELSKLGAEVEEYADGFKVIPKPDYHAAEIETYNDHRIAMSFTLAGLGIQGVKILDPGCTSKTFPDFFDVLESCFSV